MSYISEATILSLMQASEQYRDYIEPPIDLEPFDSSKLTYGEFSSILQGKGWDKKESTDEKFVLDYIFSDQSRHGFRNISKSTR